MSVRHDHEKCLVENPARVHLPVGTKFRIRSAAHPEMDGTFQVKVCPDAKGGRRCKDCYFDPFCVKMGISVDAVLPECTVDETETIFVQI